MGMTRRWQHALAALIAVAVLGTAVAQAADADQVLRVKAYVRGASVLPCLAP